MAEGWEVEVHAGHQQTLARYLFQHLQPGLIRRLPIYVEHQPDARIAELKRGEVHDVAPDQQRLSSRLDQPATVTRRVARLGDNGESWKRFTARQRAQARLVRRRRRLSHGDRRLQRVRRIGQHVGGKPECGLVRMHHQLGILH